MCYASIFGAQQAIAIPKSPEALARIADRILDTNVAYGGISSFYRPDYMTTMQADLKFNNEEPVFIVNFPNGPRIYPQSIMVWHQVVNEPIGNTSYAITYCPITGSLAAYQSTLDGTELRFDVEGKLYDGNTILIDRNTGSLWLQTIGMAFRGPLAGRGMPIVPVYWTKWGAAKTVFPDAPVLATPRGSRKAYGRDPYGNYLKKGTYYDNETLAFAVQYTDTRLPYKNPVLGIEYNGFLLAVDIKYVKQHGAVNFFLGDSPLLAVHDTKLDVVRIFNRHVWEKPSLFIMENGQLIDIGTHTTWNPATGQALKGNMVGATMQQYFGVYSMWFNWYNIHPETYLIPGPGEVPKNVLHIKPLDQQ